MGVQTEEVTAERVVLDPAASVGGSRTFGEATVIAWEPSSTEVAVKVTVMFQGTIISLQKLDPNGKLSMNYCGLSGDDFTKGTLKAKFSGGGFSGQLDTDGSISWKVSGGEGSYQGFVGAWSVPQVGPQC